MKNINKKIIEIKNTRNNGRKGIIQISYKIIGLCVLLCRKLKKDYQQLKICF